MEFEGASMRKWSLVVVVMFLGVTFSALTILPGNAKASTLYVGGAELGNYTTIQGAIDDANPGDTVYVFNGTYLESVIVNKTISLVGEGRDTTFVDPGSGAAGIKLAADWVNVTGFSVRNGSQGIVVDYGFDDCRIDTNNVSYNYEGILILSSKNSIVINNIAFSNNGSGIEVSTSEHSTVADNTVFSNVARGILVHYSGNSTLTNNTVHSNEYAGIYFAGSYHNELDDNTIYGNGGPGIDLDYSVNTTVVDNEMLENGIWIRMGSLEYWNTHTIETSNTVNGKPVHYWKNTVGGTIPSGAGQVILANCTNVTVDGQIIGSPYSGIMIGHSSRNTITNNGMSSDPTNIFLFYSDNHTIANNTANSISLASAKYNTIEDNELTGDDYYAMYVKSSDNNTIAKNRVYNNRNGIWMDSSDGNNITGNNIFSHTGYGIYMYYGHENSITENTITDNEWGIYTWSSYDNAIYHNNFINNTNQSVDGGTNSWDDGYPSGGNYWSDYAGVDNCSGPSQDVCPDPDGIGDTPYPSLAAGLDGFPLMEPLPLEVPTPENQRPVCEIVHPVEHERIHETHTISGTASDEDGTIVKVEIRIDNGSWIQVNWNTSWSYEWDTTNVSNGEYTIYARSYDGEDYSDEVNVTVDVHNPTEEEMMYGEIFFWTAVVLVVIIALVGLGLEVRRRKKEEP